MAFKANVDVRPFTQISIVLDDLLLLVAYRGGKFCLMVELTLQRCILCQLDKTFYVAETCADVCTSILDLIKLSCIRRKLHPMKRFTLILCVCTTENSIPYWHIEQLEERALRNSTLKYFIAFLKEYSVLLHTHILSIRINI